MSKLVRKFTIEEMQPEDFVAANEVRLQSWIDTYVNEEAGVTREWVENRNALQRTPEKVARRRQLMEDAESASWVAKNVDGEIIGVVGPYRDEQGTQHVGSLYVSKEYRGTGVGSTLMQKVIEWSNPSKSIVAKVATYNEPAKAFYRKWGFVEVPNSDTLFDNTIPEVMMVRKGEKE